MLNAVIIRSFIGRRGGNEHIPGRQDIPNCAHFSLEKYRKRNFFVYIDLVARPSHCRSFQIARNNLRRDQQRSYNYSRMVMETRNERFGIL